jgi:Co/Zn/Cd efflux system component
MVALSGHVVVHEEDFRPTMLVPIRRFLHDRLGIDHLTIQLETESLVETATCA